MSFDKKFIKVRGHARHKKYQKCMLTLIFLLNKHMSNFYEFRWKCNFSCFVCYYVFNILYSRYFEDTFICIIILIAWEHKFFLSSLENNTNKIRPRPPWVHSIKKFSVWFRSLYTIIVFQDWAISNNSTIFRLKFALSWKFSENESIDEVFLTLPTSKTQLHCEQINFKPWCPQKMTNRKLVQNKWAWNWFLKSCEIIYVFSLVYPDFRPR